MELTLRRITSKVCCRKKKQTTWGNMARQCSCSANVFYCISSEWYPFYRQPHCNVWFYKIQCKYFYVTCTIQMLSIIVKELVALINILILNDFLQFHGCHHLYFPLRERAELVCNNSLDCIPTNCIYKLRFEPSSFTNPPWDGFLIWCHLLRWLFVAQCLWLVIEWRCQPFHNL